MNKMNTGENVSFPSIIKCILSIPEKEKSGTIKESKNVDLAEGQGK